MQGDETTSRRAGDCTCETDEEMDLSQNVWKNEKSNVVLRDGKLSADACLSDYRRYPLKLLTKLLLIKTSAELVENFNIRTNL